MTYDERIEAIILAFQKDLPASWSLHDIAVIADAASIAAIEEPTQAMIWSAYVPVIDHCYDRNVHLAEDAATDVWRHFWSAIPRC